MSYPPPIDYGSGDERSSSVWSWIAIVLAAAAYPSALLTVRSMLKSSAADSAIWIGFGVMVLLCMAAMILATIAALRNAGSMALTMLALVLGAGTLVWCGVIFVSGLVGSGGWAMVQ